MRIEISFTDYSNQSYWNGVAENIANFGVALSILVAILLVWWQLRQQSKLASAEMMIALERSFESPEHRKMRIFSANVIKDFIDNAPLEPLDEEQAKEVSNELSRRLPVLSILETCGELLIRKVLKEHDVVGAFGFYLFGYAYFLRNGRQDVKFFRHEREHQENAWVGIEMIFLSYVEQNKLFLLPEEKQREIAMNSLNHEITLTT